MSQQAMYGLNMGIGFTEVLSHSYDIDASGSWRYANEFDYKNSSVESTIATIWQQTYNSIANVNILIRNINEASPQLFTENHYDTYRGEAYGLRGFLHLDLMRLFACAPSMDSNAKGVPYVTEYSTEVVGQKTVKETMQMVIDDLTKAREYLSTDSLKEGYSRYTQRASRIPYFNYYAATLALARAYLWNGDKQNALKYANEIIDCVEDSTSAKKNSKPFSFITPTRKLPTATNSTWRSLASMCSTLPSTSGKTLPTTTSSRRVAATPSLHQTIQLRTSMKSRQVTATTTATSSLTNRTARNAICVSSGTWTAGIITTSIRCCA